MNDELPPLDFELVVDEGASPKPSTPGAPTGFDPVIPLVLFGLLALIVGWLAIAGHETAEQSARRDPDVIVRSIPEPLLVAELFAADPGPAKLRDLLDVIGGFDGVTLASAQGAFDLVRFDPLDPDRLLASNRLSYGDAENQDVNELWQIGETGVEQALWAPNTSHDFVHFNTDGTVTMWSHGGGPGFAPRSVRLLDGEFGLVASTDPLYASRFSIDGQKLFALTGDGVLGPRNEGYENLIADDGVQQTILAPGSPYGWIDNPIPGMLIAYPRTDSTTIAVWNTLTLDPADDHPLAGRSYQRLAISGDHEVAVGITFDGQLEELVFRTGDVVSTFGAIDPVGIDQPITLNDDGTIAITVDRVGLVTMWWVGEDTPILVAPGDAGQPRWVSDQYAARFASAVASNGSRVALRSGARPEVPVQWTIIDTDVDSWVQRACRLAGRPLTPEERRAILLVPGREACE